MATIQEYFSQAQLALAAYANLTAGKPRDAELIKAACGMSPSHAAQFAKEWAVVDQYNETIPVYDELGNYIGERTGGLSATLFERDGKRYLAIRGTEPSDGQDVIADIDLSIGSGVATQQAVSLRCVAGVRSCITYKHRCKTCFPAFLGC